MCLLLLISKQFSANRNQKVNRGNIKVSREKEKIWFLCETWLKQIFDKASEFFQVKSHKGERRRRYISKNVMWIERKISENGLNVEA